MKKLVLLSCIVFAFISLAHGQIRQGKTLDERANEKTEQIRRVEEERRLAEGGQNGNAVEPKPAVMNVDVQMALTKLEYKNFAEAKPNATKEITDGDNLWLYVKFNGKLDRYIYRLQEESGERYVLFVEFGPEGDTTAKSHSIIEFRREELSLTEMKMSLSPGRAGRHNALAIFVKNAAASKPGRWSNELRITNFPGFPRGFTDYLAKAAFVCDFTRGLVKYPKMVPAFESMVLRDTLDETKLPIVGKFEDASVRTSLNTRLTAEKIVATRVYFSGDSWLEYSDTPTSQRQYREVTGVVQYQTGTKCVYATARIRQTYSPMDNRYGDSLITFRKDIPTPCEALKTLSR